MADVHPTIAVILLTSLLISITQGKNCAGENTTKN